MFTEAHKAEWEMLSDETSHYYTGSSDPTWVIDKLIRIKASAPVIDRHTDQMAVEEVQCTLKSKLSVYHRENHPKVST